MPAFGAARVEEEIVKIPENEIVVTLGRPQAAVAGGVDLEQDLAIDQHGEQLEPRKTVLPTQSFDRLRCGQQGQGGRDLRIANPEQRAGARRLQDHLVAAPAQVREPRQDENVGLADLLRSRPIVGNLRLDDDLVLALILAVARAPEAVLQQAVSGQSPDQELNLLVDAPALGRKRAERQTRAQVLRAIRRAGAELSQAHRMAIEAGDDVSVRARFERDVSAEPGGESCRRSSPWLCSGSAQAGTTLRSGDEAD